MVTNLLGSAGLPQEVVDRIVAAAEGNPLYVEQMLSMLIDSGALRREGDQWVRAEGYGEITVPPTIKALLEARLDKLARADRATVEPASVIGLEFERPAIEALAPEAVRPEIAKHLDTLARKHFIDLAGAEQAETIYRFHHHLVRDTVYNGLLKRTRANLHLGFVRWADKVNADNDRALEFEAILGYHLEQAYRYLGELGPLDEAGVAIGADAARRLANAGKRAFDSSDMHAAANLFQRATALLSVEHLQRAELLVEFGRVLIGLGDFTAAREAQQQVWTAAERLSNPRMGAASQILGILISHFSGEQSDSGGATLASAHELIPLLERESAHYELALAWRLVMLEHATAGRFSQAIEAVEHSSAHARLAGNDLLAADNRGLHSTFLLLGPTPVPQAIVQCEEQIAESQNDRMLESELMCTLAQLKAMMGELSAARDLCRHARRVLRSLGKGVFAASTGIAVMHVELHGGDLAIAEREVREDYAFLESAGETYLLSTMAALLSRVVRDQGRDEEALAFSKSSEQASAAEDVEAQALWRSIRAPILVRAGDIGLAEEMARQALEFALRAESPRLQADVLSELAYVLGCAGRPMKHERRSARRFHSMHRRATSSRPAVPARGPMNSPRTRATPHERGAGIHTRGPADKLTGSMTIF